MYLKNIVEINFDCRKRYYNRQGTYVVKKVFTKYKSVPKRYRRNSNHTRAKRQQCK